MKKKVLIILLIIFFVISIVPKTFQNDTFYTIAIGKDILEYGFDGIEHHSWHEGLSYTSPHWLFDVVNYLIYNIASFDGLYIFTCFFACLTMVLFYWTLRRKDVNYIVAFIGTLVVSYLLRDSFTDRAQIVSYMLLLLENYLLDNFMKTKNKKNILGIFLISIIISNVHLGVYLMMIVLVLPYLGEYIFSIFAIDNVVKINMRKTKKKIEKLKLKNADEDEIKKLEDSIKYDENFLSNYKPKENGKITIAKNNNVKYLFLILLVILIGGLFTPNGMLTYTYFIKLSMGNSLNYINEHLPLVVASSVEFVVFVIFTITCIGFIDSKMTLSEAFLLLGLYFMTFISRRHMILLFLLGAPILIKMIDSFVKKNLNIDISSYSLKLQKSAFIVFSVIAIIIAIYNYVIDIDEEYINETLYPVEAAEWLNSYIEENDIENIHLYNGYNYGSYLLYQGIPVFIDSRAEPYTPEFNEDTTIFDDYVDLQNGNITYTELFEKYEIDYVLVYEDSLENTYLKEDETAELLYEDEYFVIYHIVQ